MQVTSSHMIQIMPHRHPKQASSLCHSVPATANPGATPRSPTGFEKGEQIDFFWPRRSYRLSEVLSVRLCRLILAVDI